MIDPLDHETLTLKLQAPKTNAERQRDLRRRRREQRAAGQRATLDLNRAELAVVGVALIEFRERWQHMPDKVSAVEALLPRVPAVLTPEAFADDPAGSVHGAPAAAGAARNAPGGGVEAALQALEGKLGELQKALERERRECAMLEDERNRAFAAYKVLEDRLRAAGLSTDYR